MRKPRSGQRAKHSYADGHVKRSPTGHDPHRHSPVDLRDFPSGNLESIHFGPRRESKHEVLVETNITRERSRSNAHPLSHRFTKFITNMHGQVRIPHDVIGRRGTVVAGGVKCLDIYEVPED